MYSIYPTCMKDLTIAAIVSGAGEPAGYATSHMQITDDVLCQLVGSTAPYRAQYSKRYSTV